MVIVLGRSFSAVDAATPLDHIQIQLKNALLREHELRYRNYRELDAFSQKRATGGQEQVFDQLLSDCRRPAPLPPVEILFRGSLDFLPVKTVVREKTGILGGHDGVLQGRRNLVERYED